MKPNLYNPYGYKICYTKHRFKKQYIDIFHAHTYKTAMKIKKECVIHRKFKRGRKKFTYQVVPITKKEVKRGIWKKPF